MLRDLTYPLGRLAAECHALGRHHHLGTTMAPPIWVLWILFCLLYGAGVLLITLGVPLFRRRIPRNPLYGVRVPATLADERVWYPINAQGGRDLIVLGFGYLGAVTVALRFGGTWPLLGRIFGPLGFLVVGLLIDGVVLWRRANRLAHALRAGSSAPPS